MMGLTVFIPPPTHTHTYTHTHAHIPTHTHTHTHTCAGNIPVHHCLLSDHAGGGGTSTSGQRRGQDNHGVRAGHFHTVQLLTESVGTTCLSVCMYASVSVKPG